MLTGEDYFGMYVAGNRVSCASRAMTLLLCCQIRKSTMISRVSCGVTTKCRGAEKRRVDFWNFAATLVCLLTLAVLTPGSAWAGEIHNAVKAGDEKAVRAILAARPAALEERDADGETPLFIAAYEGRETIVAVLLDAGANPVAKTAKGSTPFIVAAYVGSPQIIRRFIAAKAPVNSPLANGLTPLHIASILASKLAETDSVTGAKTYKFYDNAASAKLLIEAGADVNAVAYDEQLTPLMIAARDGVTPVVQLLLNAHADVGKRDTSGKTALHYAASAKQYVSLRIVQNGPQEQRQYLYASSAQVITLLLQAGADANLRDKDGKTPSKLAEESYLKDNIEAFKASASK
jgi:ankyrin repeat protein